MYEGEVQPDTKTAVVKSKLSKKETLGYQISEDLHNFKTSDLVLLCQFIRVNEMYAHRSEPICSRYLIWRDIKTEEIQGVTGTWGVDVDYELPSINPILIECFQCLKENKDINTCWLQSENSLETSEKLIHKLYWLDIHPFN